MRRFWLAVSLSTAAHLSLAVSGARAEAFVDLYAGGAFTSSATQKLEVDGVASGSGSGGFEDSWSLGGRAGYWLESAPWLGVALDVSYFAADEDATSGAPQLEIDVVPISPLLMLRAPLLKNSDFPRGRLQPYVGIGPGIFVSDLTLDLASVGGPKVADTRVDVGVDVRAGVNFHFLESWAVFAEYRFTQLEPSFEDSAGGSSVEVKTQLDTHHVIAGLGFHF